MSDNQKQFWEEVYISAIKGFCTNINPFNVSPENLNTMHMVAGEIADTAVDGWKERYSEIAMLLAGVQECMKCKKNLEDQPSVISNNMKLCLECSGSPVCVFRPCVNEGCSKLATHRSANRKLPYCSLECEEKDEKAMKEVEYEKM